MLTYAKLKDNPRRFLAVTSVTQEEVHSLLPVFAEAYAATQSPTHTQAGQPRQRGAGGGRPARLATVEDKLLFILMYQKTYPLQTVHGLHFGLGQAQTNDWIHRLMPILDTALERLGYTPERDPGAFSQQAAPSGPPRALQLDGTERRRRRPKNPAKQREHYSGKKKAHTDKNLILADEQTRQVVYLSQTQAGKTNDKQVADQEAIRYPDATRLTKDMGFQGYEPANVVTIQPKKPGRGRFLGTADRLAHRLIARARIVVEHVLAGVKRCRIVTEVFRNTKPGFSDLVMQVACALHNLRTDFRLLRSLPYQLKHYFR